jgi:MYXO-CTERM domain-containing protein
MRTNFVTAILMLSCSATVLSVVTVLAQTPRAAPGPIPDAGVLSYAALGLVGLGAAGWKRWRRNRDK